jgi:hypothetical protein
LPLSRSARPRCSDAPEVQAGSLGNLGEFTFHGFGDAGVKRAPRLAQQSAIGRVLYQCVLEQIGRLRRETLAEEQTSRDEAV